MLERGMLTRSDNLSMMDFPKAKINQFNAKKIFTLGDLLDFFPRDYYDFTNPVTMKEVRQNPENPFSIIGKLAYKTVQKWGIIATFYDKNHERFNVTWFGRTYLQSQLIKDKEYIICGTFNKTEKNGKTYENISPIMFSDKVKSLQKIIPVYSKIPGMADEYLLNRIEDLFHALRVPETLDEDIREKFGVTTISDAYEKIHFPKTMDDVKIGMKRINFEKMFVFALGINCIQSEQKESDFVPKNNEIWDKIRKKIPFALTKDQDAAIENMYEYMQEKKPLNALVQGDVGSGKTIVAIMMMALGIGQYQSCMMAPTEVLAKQHYEGALEIFDGLDVKIAYLSGNQKAKEKRENLEMIESGEADLIFGTHALIFNTTKFKNLGMVITDEQHKFGVKQRDSLLSQEKQPHVIVMSATPIPRTISFAIFGGHIQIYNIQSRPEGRLPIKTMRIEDDKKINQMMLDEIRKGRQCYVVCPFIEKSESERFAHIQSVEDTTAALRKYFKNNPEVKITEINGKMKQKDVDAEILKFKNLESNILVSTTIVEVGVNVPNATLIVLKNSERFGLAQAHQLRGRVGRSSLQSYCILQTYPQDPKAEILCETNDGFEISEKDVILRGSGDFFGTAQTGENKQLLFAMKYPKRFEEIKNFFDAEKIERYKHLLEN